MKVECSCGSQRVTGIERRGIKSNRVVAVDWRCLDCGAKQRVGASELSAPAYVSKEELRKRGFDVK